MTRRQTTQNSLLASLLLVSVAVSATEEPDFLREPRRTVVQVELEVIGPQQTAPSGHLTAWPVGRPEEVTEIEVTGGVAPPFAMLEAAPFELKASFPGYWAFHQVVNLRSGERSRPQKVRLWPLGTVTGKLRLAKKPQKVPAQLEVRMEPPPLKPPTGELPWGAIRCPVAAGQFTCELPGARLNLSIHLPGYAPTYRWGLVVEPGQQRNLGDVALRPGGSIAGWVESDGSLDAGAGAAIQLKPATLGGGTAASRALTQRASRNQLADANGFFHFDDLEPGTYSLAVSRPGFGPVQLAALKIVEDEHLLLDQPLRLRALFDLSVEVGPPADWRGRPWRVEVARVPQTEAEKDLAKPRGGPVRPDGGLTVPALTPGLFSLNVLDSAGNSFYAKHDQPLGGNNPSNYTVELSPIAVKGRVRYGEQPVAGEVWFGGRNGAVRISFRSDDEGAFQGSLPRAGNWRVDILGETPAINLRTRVTFEASQQGSTQVDLEIPSTEAFGRVLGEEGRPVDAAKVVLVVGQDRFEQASSLSGEFRFLGVPAGSAAVIAEKVEGSARRTSERATAELRENEENGPIELRLQKTRPLRGVVRSEQGPVPGAHVTLQAHRPKLGFGSDTFTLEGGEFTTEVPAQATALLAVVMAPGFGLRAAELATGGQRSEIQLFSQVGELEIALPLKASELAGEGLNLLVLQDGLQLATGLLFSWAQAHGKQFLVDESTLAVPALAPGHYRACIAGTSALTDWDFTAATLPTRQCSDGFVTAGETLRLKVPSFSL